MNCPNCGRQVSLIAPGGYGYSPMYRCYNSHCMWSGYIGTREAWKDSDSSCAESVANRNAITSGRKP